MTARRNGEIDFLRLIFALLVVFFHFNSNYKLGFFPNGYIGVEYFFVVSGFLMASHVAKRGLCYKDLGTIADETWHFALNKTKSFYSYYISVVLLQVIIRYILVRHTSIAELGYRFLQAIPTFTLTFMGLDKAEGSLYVGNTWYLSAMLIAIFLLYPLLLRQYKFSVEIIFPVISLFLLGYQFATNKSIANWEGWSGIAYFGVFRALAEMTLGASLYQLSASWLVKTKLVLSERPIVKTFLTLFKVFCYLVVVVFAYGSVLGEPFQAGFNLHALLFCSLGILLSFSNVGYCIPDSKATRYLGKISLPIFIYHGFIRWTLWDYIGHSISMKLFSIIIIISIVASIALMYLTDFLASKFKKIVEKI